MKVTERLRWITVQGPHAFCGGCDWVRHGDNESRQTIAAARRHARKTGHVVSLQRGDAAEVRSEQEPTGGEG